MKWKILGFATVISFFVICFTNAQNSSGAERILGFDGEIKINSDSSINVKEIIDYDFGGAQKHGIYRFIPVKYKARGGNYNLRVSDVKITDENGAPQNYTTAYESENIKFQIGDANKFVSGQKNYVISYVIRRAVNYFPDHDELYWNFTGDKWPVPIENASVEVILPENARENLQYKCFEGFFGTTNECAASASENILEYRSANILNPGEGLTIVAGWPKGITPEPSFFQKIWEIVKDNWTLFVPIAVFVFMYRLWSKKGRDPKGRGTIIAQYEPPDKLAPAEIGTMLDGSADSKDVSSTIIDLAVNKFLKIRRSEEKGFLGIKSADYKLIRLKDEEPDRDFEKEVIKGIFAGEKEKKLSELKNKFYKTLATVTSQLYEGVAKKGYYVSNPNNTRILWIVSGVIGGGLLAGIFGSFQGAWGILSGIVSGTIILFFGWLMPAVTKKGAELKENILGFKDYLSVTETDRLKFHNAPEKTPESFEKFLPYAMVLGVEKEWAKQFEGIYNRQPDWYEDSSGRAFNAIILSSLVSDFSSTATSAMASQPSSAAGGGSGFSGGGGGGGFGGGGGGSW
ncbi:MAG: hypothetical protein A2359_04510 [Candidatus Moranbacteria bacterium RIFOXYB1_FULL_43_19]|nr:MAG: hypothetical protein A2359_04510 [Candidatus Moranbacteria bacterium RIFOXYB1_FULL_43_19]OGI33729.1 MAG: hypothetical protein A2420_00970 [Candidatus Moranbacteria bacterium RIFOXYC1_FULL_44_13]OGI37689.1 MAG: hypothetical protein A2612_02845 [Candidatus Moranbacteria bacterium RIFOXYD1_FULL_44_12]